MTCTLFGIIHYSWWVWWDCSSDHLRSNINHPVQFKDLSLTNIARAPWYFHTYKYKKDKPYWAHQKIFLDGLIFLFFNPNTVTGRGRKHNNNISNQRLMEKTHNKVLNRDITRSWISEVNMECYFWIEIFMVMKIQESKIRYHVETFHRSHTSRFE